ncbi:PID-CTERM protein-sorting domain-containing protein [Hymenobacter psychrotolerans]|uniref:Uncharacterized protein n=1 Tax=Hymenobacter psychrotolerans DSM 18569 TaxID=1121959 RepID=A0A1M6X7Z0_9BACT|nr:hypothetical protein [Hymenobacter psychrotolerans]SHL02036.1 hypothetical protein SAMN02746009_01963 [Hymenobacter psychrotolerans DSM 18569]
MNSIASALRLTVAATGVFLLAGGFTLAVAQGPGSGGPQPDPQQPTAVPIDGGASLLLAAGVGFGLKKLRDQRKRR